MTKSSVHFSLPFRVPRSAIFQSMSTECVCVGIKSAFSGDEEDFLMSAKRQYSATVSDMCLFNSHQYLAIDSWKPSARQTEELSLMYYANHKTALFSKYIASTRF